MIVKLLPPFSGFLISAILIAASLTGCGSSAPLPSLDAHAIYTQAAETLVFQLTLKAGQEAVAALTEMARVSPTPRPRKPTHTPTRRPSPTPQPPTESPASPTEPPLAALCNWAEFLGDVTADRGAAYLPGASFTKTWRIKNFGACPWTRDYSLVFFDGDQMDGPDMIPLLETVSPGETIDISVDLTAPEKEGTYSGYWMLRSASGDYFGVGEQGNEALLVEIRSRTPSEIVFDFSANYCSAAWNSSVSPIPCPSYQENTDIGFVLLNESPVLENGMTDNDPAIVTLPNKENGGYISGRFPAFRVRPGDHFKTVIGCLYDNLACNVLFQLNYSANGGPVMNLDTWNEVYDGKFTRVDIDLTSLAGKSVEFILTVLNNGDNREDWVFWLKPAILR